MGAKALPGTRPPAGFTVHLDDNRQCRVRFVSRAKVGRLEGDEDGHPAVGEYDAGVIQLARYETHRGQKRTLLHELGHWIYELAEHRSAPPNEEEICDMFIWLDDLLSDPRNQALRDWLSW